jgi:hypothetical protein
MYRQMSVRQVGMSGVLDSIANAIKGVVSGIKVTVPPYQIPGTTPPPGYSYPSGQQQANPSATPDWVMPVALGAVGVLGLMMVMGSRRR